CRQSRPQTLWPLPAKQTTADSDTNPCFLNVKRFEAVAMLPPLKYSCHARADDIVPQSPCIPRLCDAPAPPAQDTLQPLVRLATRSEEHTSELQSRENLVCRLLLEKKNNTKNQTIVQYL